MLVSSKEINHVLAGISLKIGQSPNVEEILQFVVEEVGRLIKCDRVMVYRFLPDEGGIIVAEFVANSQWKIWKDVSRYEHFKSINIEPCSYNKIHVCDELESNEENVNFINQKLYQDFGVKANLVAPIVPAHSSATWGLLLAHQCQQPRQWQKQEIDLFKQLSKNIAIAIWQTELLQRTHRELKERQFAEKQAQKAKQFLQTIIDRLPMAVYVKNAEEKNFGQFQLWNRATEKIFNLEAPKVLGKTVQSYFAPKQAQKFIRQDLAAIEVGKTLIIPEEEIKDREGKTQVLHKIKIPLYDKDRQPEHLLCIAEDITARKQAEQELKQKSAELAAFSDNLKLLHRLNTTDYQDSEELFRDHLQTGCQMFDAQTGIVGIVTEDVYTVYALESNLKSLFPKMQLSLQDTYCAGVVEKQETISYNCVGEIARMSVHPLYKSLRFESYIGTPIFVNGALYGTLCFASQYCRAKDFSDRERETIEMMAQSIGRFIFANRIEKERQEAQTQLTQAKKELELRVLQRTAELEIVNHHLQEELQERKQIQFELQASQDNLQESERRWRSLLENIRLLVVGIDAQNNVDYVNPYFLELTGYRYDETIGRNWFDNFVHPRERDEVLRIHRNILEVDSGCSHQYHQQTILTKTGESRTIAWNSTQLRNLEGIPTGTMCIGKDITESQAIERMKDEFISVVSHELRTPLTSIRGALGLLATGALNTQSEKGERIVKIAAESTEHLVRLVDDILELERLESGKIELVIEPVTIDSLISQAVRRVQMFANKKQIVLQATKFNGQFLGDSDRLLQVLTNLLSNAIKFSDAGSTVWIDVRCASASDSSPQPEIIFAVRDRGRGIPADSLEDIFERFHQVDASDSRHKGGTGLGLSICRSIVEQHGGKIWLDSVYGEGTTFYFSIPLSKDNR